MSKYFTKEFASYVTERALKTVIQALIAGGLIGAGLFDLDVAAIASLAGGTALLSVATSVLVYKGDGSDDPNETSQA